jgi:demethylmenaquinone methyltransferase/2-methoxy-6-polyprenyl-1,4-benzoquinol methylase
LKINTEISRVTRSKDEARDIYDRISKWYDLLEGVWEKKSRSAALAKLAVKDGEKVLEIGFGTGHSIVALARSVGEHGSVCGIDIAPRMLDIARKRVKESGLAKRIELALGDATILPYETHSFDAVFMSFTLELFNTPEIPLVLSECRRVLQKCGRICVVSLSKTGGPSRMRDLYEWGHKRFPRLLDCRPIFVRKALEDAGFRCPDVDTTEVFWMPVEIVLAIKPA